MVYKKLTLTAKSNKNGKKILKVQFCFLTENQILVASELHILEQERLPLKNNKEIRKAVF